MRIESESGTAPGRLAGHGPIGVIDIGSNSVRLVVYERLARTPTLLFNEKVLAGLGRGVASTGRLNEQAVEQSVTAVRRFRALCNRFGVVSLDVLATAAARDASNGPAFLAEVERITGVAPALLTGPEEARQSALGVIAGFWRPDGIAGDLGGGSLELIDIRGGEIGAGRTFPLGGLRLQDMTDGSVRKAEKIAAEALARSDLLAAGQGRTFYAIGGTWRSLARLHMAQTGYPLHVMHHYSMAASEAQDFCRTIARGDLDTLDCIEVVSRQRRGLLPYGAVVLGEVIKSGRFDRIVLSALGLREGHLFEKLGATEQGEDPLISACAELNHLRSRVPALADELVRFTDTALSAIEIEETENERRLRIAACHLSDIGWRAHPDYRGEQSLSIIQNASFVGVDHPGRAYLALAVFYRYAGLVDEALSPRIRELVSTRLKERARSLGSALRIAYVVAGAVPGVVGRCRVERSGDLIRLVLPADLADIDGERLRKRLDQFAKLAGMKGQVVVGA